MRQIRAFLAAADRDERRRMAIAAQLARAAFGAEGPAFAKLMKELLA